MRVGEFPFAGVGLYSVGKPDDPHGSYCEADAHERAVSESTPIVRGALLADLARAMLKVHLVALSPTSGEGFLRTVRATA